MKNTTSESYDSNIVAWLKLAELEDIRAGREWYFDGQAIVRAISAETELSPAIVAAVVACLSPGVDWLHNVADAHAFCRAWAGGRNTEPSACGYPANRTQAWRILEQGDPSLLTGPKRVAFAANLLGELEHVTVDRWAIRAATGFARDRVAGPAQYKVVTDAYSRVAHANGFAPAVLQAIIWVTIKRITER